MERKWGNGKTGKIKDWKNLENAKIGKGEQEKERNNKIKEKEITRERKGVEGAKHFFFYTDY